MPELTWADLARIYRDWRIVEYPAASDTNGEQTLTIRVRPVSGEQKGVGDA